jgi:hypothetical protein
MHICSEQSEVKKITDLSTKLTNSYISLLKNMSRENKQDLISKLRKTIETDTIKEKADFYKAFGGWDDAESAEELIKSIKSSK